MNVCGEIALQQMLGHESRDMVQKYVKLWGRDIQNIHRQIDPVDNLIRQRRI